MKQVKKVKMKLKYPRIKEYIQYLEKTKQEELLNNISRYYNQDLYDSLIETEYNTMLLIHIMDTLNIHCRNTGKTITTNEEITSTLKIIIPSTVITEPEPVSDSTLEKLPIDFDGIDEGSVTCYTIRETKSDGTIKDRGYYFSYNEGKKALQAHLKVIKEYYLFVEHYPIYKVEEILDCFELIKITV